MDSLPDGVGGGESPASQRLVDQNDRRRVGPVARLEQATANQRNSQDLEVPRGYRRPKDPLIDSRVDLGVGLELNTELLEVAAQGQLAGERCRSDARHRSDRL